MAFLSRLVVLLLCSCSMSFANGNKDYLDDLREKTYVFEGSAPLVNAAQDIKRYSENGGVGIILHYLPWVGGHTAEDIASAFVTKLEEHQVESDFRVAINDQPGVRVFFVINGVSQGPYAPRAAYEMLADIAKQNELAHGH